MHHTAAALILLLMNQVCGSLIPRQCSQRTAQSHDRRLTGKRLRKRRQVQRGERTAIVSHLASSMASIRTLLWPGESHVMVLLSLTLSPASPLTHHPYIHSLFHRITSSIHLLPNPPYGPLVWLSPNLIYLIRSPLPHLLLVSRSLWSIGELRHRHQDVGSSRPASRQLALAACRRDHLPHQSQFPDNQQLRRDPPLGDLPGTVQCEYTKSSAGHSDPSDTAVSSSRSLLTATT